MKNDKQGLRILAVLIFMICVLVCILINTIRANLKRYEYYKNGEVGISKECYLNEKNELMCLIDNKFISVDEFYEK